MSQGLLGALGTMLLALLLALSLTSCGSDAAASEVQHGRGGTIATTTERIPIDEPDATCFLQVAASQVTTPCENVTHWKTCECQPGCVYLPTSQEAEVQALPAFRPHVGSCVQADFLFREVPPGVQPAAAQPEGDAVEMRMNRSKVWLPQADLCSEDDPWTSSPCSQLCPVGDHHSACTKRHGCVYVYKSNDLGGVPAASRAQLEPALGNCAARDGLTGSSPAGSVWVPSREGAENVLQAKAYGGEKVMLQFPAPPDEPEASGDEDCQDDRRMAPASSWPSASLHVEHVLQDCVCVYWQHVELLGEVKAITTDYAFAASDPSEYLQVDYGCWRDVLSKSLRMPVQFEYISSADTGNEERAEYFALDETPGLLEWQPPAWARSDRYGTPYDVGHFVMANHFDGTRELIAATNFMTNVVPQHRDMNRYAWYCTEMLTECARSQPSRENVFVIGGCVWPDDPEHIEGFEKMEPYRLPIPDYCWKILSAPVLGHVAFYMPNNESAKISKSKAHTSEGVERGLAELSAFVVSVAELEEHLASRQTPQTFSMSAEEKAEKPSAQELAGRGWTLDCDHS